MRIERLAVLVGATLALLPASAVAAPAVTGEFQVRASLEANNKLVEGPDGNIWVTLTSKRSGEPDVARIDAGTGAVNEFDLPNVGGAFGIAAAGGKLWLTQDGGGVGFPGVTSFSPGDPVGTRQVKFVGGIGPECPIVAGPDGNLWVAAPGNLIRIEPEALILADKAFPIAGLEPKDIDVAGSRLAIADAGGQRIVTASAEDPPKTADFPLGVRPPGVAGAPSGQIAFSKPANELGLLTPPGPPLLTQSVGTDPVGVALGPDGGFWFAQSVTNTVTRLSTVNQVTTLAPGFARNSTPRQIAAGPDNTLWVTLPGTNRVGRISGLERPAAPPPGGPPPPTEPRTKIDRGPRSPVKTGGGKAAVRFRFSSPDAGSSFECRLVRLLVGRGGIAKAPGFKPCQSPRTFTVRPGRYRFEVRAVRGGLADGSPATRSFRVVRLSAGRG